MFVNQEFCVRDDEVDSEFKSTLFWIFIETDNIRHMKLKNGIIMKPICHDITIMMATTSADYITLEATWV